MPGNIDPIYTKVPSVSQALITAVNARNDGTGTVATDMFLGYTADATNGSFIDSVTIKAVATGATAPSPAANVIRMYRSSVTAGATTSANTSLIKEIIFVSGTTNGAASSLPDYEIPVGKGMKPGETLLFSIGTAPTAGTAFQVTVWAGNY